MERAPRHPQRPPPAAERVDPRLGRPPTQGHIRGQQRHLPLDCRRLSLQQQQISDRQRELAGNDEEDTVSLRGLEPRQDAAQGVLTSERDCF